MAVPNQFNAGGDVTRNRRLEDRVEVAENPEPRCPCVLLLDTSGSMKGERLAALTAGLFTFQSALANDPIAARRVDVSVVTFDSNVRVVQPFIGAGDFRPPSLTATGQTHMAEAIQRTLTLLERRKEFYKDEGLAYYRPWVLMITDGKSEGEPESAVAEATARLRAAERAKKVAFFAVGVADADLASLRKIVTRQPLPLRELAFDELFLWLSASMQAVSRSQPGDKVELPAMSWLNQIASFVRRHKDTIENTAAVARVLTKVVLGV
jgi:uncharacterized protein YegL